MDGGAERTRFGSPTRLPDFQLTKRVLAGSLRAAQPRLHFHLSFIWRIMLAAIGGNWWQTQYALDLAADLLFRAFSLLSTTRLGEVGASLAVSPIRPLSHLSVHQCRRSRTPAPSDRRSVKLLVKAGYSRSNDSPHGGGELRRRV